MTVCSVLKLFGDCVSFAASPKRGTPPCFLFLPQKGAHLENEKKRQQSRQKYQNATRHNNKRKPLGFNGRYTVLALTLVSFFSFFFFHLTYSRWTSSLPSCLWSQRIFPSFPGSRLTIFLSRCKFSTLTTRQPMVGFYLLTFPRFPLRKKEHKSYFGKNRTHDFRTSRCAAYLLDHSGWNCKKGI